MFELAFDFVFSDPRTLSGNKICRGNSKWEYTSVFDFVGSEMKAEGTVV